MSESAPTPIVSVHDLRKVYLERVILEEVTFTLHDGERIGLLGPNGTGKSTLLGIIAGKISPDGGDVRFRRDIRVCYLDQEGGLDDSQTVGETIDSAFAVVRALEAELDAIHEKLEADPHAAAVDQWLRRQSAIMDDLQHLDSHSVETRKVQAMQALGVPGPERIIGQLSGGERRRTALCRTLLEQGDLLLLDEPTNHLDAETLDWLEEYLANFRGTVLFITHDRYFLDRVATRMIELSRGSAKAYEGNYSDYMEAKQIEADLARRGEAVRQGLLRRELDWLRRQPKARTTKSKARIDRANDLIANRPEDDLGAVQLLIPTGPRLGNTLIEAENIAIELGGRELVKNFTFRLGAGDRVGIVGRNGLGKTTLLKVLMKHMEPDAGTVVHGQSVKFVYADQARQSLDPEKTVLQEVAGDLEWVEVGGQRITFRSWLARFLFDENTAAMPIRLLSGGERNRVQLAKMIREGGNVVILDEPTNDLDLPTLRILEEALAQFNGCAFIVSHDRYFLDRVATRILAFRGEGRVDLIEGNYSDYRRYLERIAPQEAAALEAAQKKAATPQASEPTKSAPPPAPKKKLSFKEQRELEGMEAAIMKAEENLAALDAILHDPTTFVKASKDEATKRVSDREAAQAEVARLYKRWDELSG